MSYVLITIMVTTDDYIFTIITSKALCVISMVIIQNYLELTVILMLHSFLAFSHEEHWASRVDMTCVSLMEIFFIVVYCVDDRGRVMTFSSGCTPPVDGVLIQILSLYCIDPNSLSLLYRRTHQN